MIIIDRMIPLYRYVQTILLCVIVALATVIPASAVQLVISKDSESFWVDKVEKTATELKYVDNETGTSKTMPISDVADVIPRIDKDRKYSQEEVKKNLAAVVAALRKHPRLMKQINSMRYEWEGLLKSDVDIAREVGKVMAAFTASGKTTDDYRKAKMGLEMLKYKDFSGRFGSMVDGKMDDLIFQYINLNVRDLEARAAAPDLAVSGLQRITSEIRGVMTRRLPKDIIERLSTALDQARKTISDNHINEAQKAFSKQKALESYPKCKAILLKGKEVVGGKKEPARIDEEIVALGNKTLDAIVANAKKILQKNKSIDAYFWSRGVLLKAKTDLCDKIPETKVKIGDAIAELDKEVRSRYSTYDFGEKGYPLSASDQKLFDRVRDASSINDVFSGACKEECLIIPDSLPRSADMTAVVNVRLTLVFNATQPRGRKHCIMMVAEKDGATFKHETPIASPRIRQAHASYSFRKPLSALGEGVGPISQNGDSIILYYLACRDPGEQEWRPLSLAAKIAIGK